MSDNIFKELCNRILNLFKQTESKEENAKDVARNRLRVVLMQDRTNLTPDLLQRMRKELVELLSKYVEMDKDALELNFDQEGDQMALMLSIPVIRAKDEAEIEEALAQDDEGKVSEEDAEESEAGEGDNSEGENTEASEGENKSEDEIEISEDNSESNDENTSEENNDTQNDNQQNENIQEEPYQENNNQ